MRDIKSMVLKKAAKAVKSVAEKTEHQVAFTTKGFYQFAKLKVSVACLFI